MQTCKHTLRFIIEFYIFLRQLNESGGDRDAELFGIQPILILFVPINDLFNLFVCINDDFIAVCNINHA